MEFNHLWMQVGCIAQLNRNAVTGICSKMEIDMNNLLFPVVQSKIIVGTDIWCQIWKHFAKAIAIIDITW